MSAANAREAAERWVAESGIPADLRGRVVQLVTFTSEESCRFFYPRRALKFHLMIGSAISGICRARRAKIARVELTEATYQAWLREAERTDSEGARRAYAESFQRVLE